MLTLPRFQILFAEIMDDAMRDHVLACRGLWNEPIAHTDSNCLPRSVQHASPSKCTQDLCEWIENRYAKLTVQVFEILNNGLKVSWSQVEKWKEMSIGHLGKGPF
jgi:anaphase-promoting complex subunit 2